MCASSGLGSLNYLPQDTNQNKTEKLRLRNQTNNNKVTLKHKQGWMLRLKQHFCFYTSMFIFPSLFWFKSHWELFSYFVLLTFKCSKTYSADVVTQQIVGIVVCCMCFIHSHLCFLTPLTLATSSSSSSSPRRSSRDILPLRLLEMLQKSSDLKSSPSSYEWPAVSQPLSACSESESAATEHKQTWFSGTMTGRRQQALAGNLSRRSGGV